MCLPFAYRQVLYICPVTRVGPSYPITGAGALLSRQVGFEVVELMGGRLSKADKYLSVQSLPRFRHFAPIGANFRWDRQSARRKQKRSSQAIHSLLTAFDSSR